MELNAASIKKLSAFLSDHFASPVTIDNAEKLSGGAIQENWGLHLTVAGGPDKGDYDLVLRCDAPSSVFASHGRAEEFKLLQAAYAAGVKVPKPFVLCTDTTVLGVVFFVMERMPGIAHGHRVTGGDKNPGLAHELGRQLAKIHTLTPGVAGLDFLAPPAVSPAGTAVAHYRAYLDETDWPCPALEWGLKWLENHAPETTEQVLCHRDFRTGNYLLDKGRLTAILDWEFSGWGDRMEDLGWFTARCWRFGSPHLEAGGIGDARDFYHGYEQQSGVKIDRDGVFYWQVMAHVRWAVIAISQSRRHVSGKEPSLELALTGHVVPELEWQVLAMISDKTGGPRHA